MNLDQWIAYRDFVVERHRIWERRQCNFPGPWTADPVLASRKFTNVFRVLDPGTQFFIRNLVDDDPRDTLFRAFLYRHTGRVEAWEHLLREFGLPRAVDCSSIYDVWVDYRGPGVYHAKSGEQKRVPGSHHIPSSPGYTDYKRSVFTGAYLVFPQSQVPGTDKMKSIVDLADRLFHPESGEDIWPRFQSATTQRERFLALQQTKGVGNFMAMQILTDWGYTPHSIGDLENEFVVAGPGAVKGAALIFPGVPAEQAIVRARDMLLQDPDCPTLGHRVPSLMDIQNTFCEFSKYARYLLQPVKQQPYKAAHPGQQEPPVLPGHWN